MEPSDVIWGGLLAVGGAVEVWALRNDRSEDTLSERTKAWFRVDTTAGRIVFGTVWMSFATWFLFHILE